MIIVNRWEHCTNKLQEYHQILINSSLLPRRPRHKLYNPLHHMRMPTRMYTGHGEIEVRVRFDGDGFAGVLGGDVVEDAGGREGAAVFVVAGDPDTGCLVVFVVGDGEVKCPRPHNVVLLSLSRCSHKLRLSTDEYKDKTIDIYGIVDDQVGAFKVFQVRYIFVINMDLLKGLLLWIIIKP